MSVPAGDSTAPAHKPAVSPLRPQLGMRLVAPQDEEAAGGADAWVRYEKHRRADATAPARTAQVFDIAASMDPSKSAEEGVGEPSDPDKAAVVEGLALVSPDRMGWFRFYFDDQRWEWSAQVQRLHGYAPGSVIPTTELVLSHKHPDDRDKVAAAIDDITRRRGTFSSRHRIIDTSGITHVVVVIGDQFFDDKGVVIGTHGFYVDITPAELIREDMVTARVGEIADHRAPIEQAKGMLMLIYDLDDETAFGLLRWLSQHNNVKLRPLAEQISTDLRVAAKDAMVDKAVLDHVLITAHHRLAKDGIGSG